MPNYDREIHEELKKLTSELKKLNKELKRLTNEHITHFNEWRTKNKPL